MTRRFATRILTSTRTKAAAVAMRCAIDAQSSVHRLSQPSTETVNRLTETPTTDFYQDAYGDVYGEHGDDGGVKADGARAHTASIQLEALIHSTRGRGGKHRKKRKLEQGQTVNMKIEDDDGDTIVVSPAPAKPNTKEQQHR